MPVVRLLFKGPRKGTPAYFLTNKKTDSVFPVFEGDKYTPAKTARHFEIVRKIHDSTKDPSKKRAHREYLDKHQGAPSSKGHGLVIKENSAKSFRVTGNVKAHAEALRALKGKSGHPYGSEQKNGDFVFSNKRREAVERLLSRLFSEPQGGAATRPVKSPATSTPKGGTATQAATMQALRAPAPEAKAPPASGTSSRAARVEQSERDARQAISEEPAVKGNHGPLHKDAVALFRQHEHAWRRVDATMKDWDADREGFRRLSSGWEALLPGEKDGVGTYKTKALAIEASKRYTKGLVASAREKADMYRGIVRMLASDKAPHEMSASEFRGLFPGGSVIYDTVPASYMAERWGIKERHRGSGMLVDDRIYYHGQMAGIRAHGARSGTQRPRLDDLHAAAVMHALQTGKAVPEKALADHPHIEKAAGPLHKLTLEEAALAHDAPGREEGERSDLYRMFKDSHMNAVAAKADEITDPAIQKPYPQLFGVHDRKQKAAWDRYMSTLAERRALFRPPAAKRDPKAIEANLKALESSVDDFRKAGGDTVALRRAPTMSAAEMKVQYERAKKKEASAKASGRMRDELDAWRDMYDLRQQFEHAKRIEHLHAKRFGGTPSLPKEATLSKGAPVVWLIKGRPSTKGKPDAFITVGASEGTDSKGNEFRNKGTVVPVWGMTPHPSKPGKLVATMKSGKVLHVDKDRHEQVKKKVAHSQAEFDRQTPATSAPRKPSAKGASAHPTRGGIRISKLTESQEGVLDDLEMAMEASPSAVNGNIEWKHVKSALAALRAGNVVDDAHLSSLNAALDQSIDGLREEKERAPDIAATLNGMIRSATALQARVARRLQDDRAAKVAPQEDPRAEYDALKARFLARDSSLGEGHTARLQYLHKLLHG